MTRRTLAIALVAAAIISLASAVIIANYVVNNSVTITSSPGLTAFEVDPATGAATTVMTAIPWGDLQQSQTQSHKVILKNSGGSQVLYILENPTNTATGVTTTISSLSAQGLPTGVTLTWNLHSSALSSAFCTVNSVQIQGCYALGQGSGTSAITMSLSADNTAIPSSTPYSFTITFNAFNSASG